MKTKWNGFRLASTGTPTAAEINSSDKAPFVTSSQTSGPKLALSFNLGKGHCTGIS